MSLTVFLIGSAAANLVRSMMGEANANETSPAREQKYLLAPCLDRCCLKNPWALGI